jgi:RNA polymerase sigma-32 factor
VDRASIQEYILRSWSLVKMGTTASQKKLFFNLRKAKSQISALEDGDLRPIRSSRSPPSSASPKQDVIDMNRRLGGDASLNAPMREEGEGEWQDWLVDDSASQEQPVDREESDNRPRRCVRRSACSTSASAHLRGAPSRRRAGDAGRSVAEFGISRERVRQIEVRAFEKVQARSRR